MLTISGKALGRRKPLFDDFSIDVPQDRGDSGLTLRDLIERIVRNEVAAFQQRQTERQFLRCLTAAEMEAGAEKGKIDSGGQEDLKQQVDSDDAVGTALQAFEDGMYLVVLDGAEQKQLDSEVFLQPDSRMTFVRLALLAGG
jgi:hypothetical protein